MDDSPALPWLARPGARSWSCGSSAPVRDGEVRAYHASLPGYALTPLAEVPALAAELGADLAVTHRRGAAAGPRPGPRPGQPGQGRAVIHGCPPRGRHRFLVRPGSG